MGHLANHTSIQNDFRSGPKDLQMLPRQPDGAVCWHNGFRRDHT